MEGSSLMKRSFYFVKGMALMLILTVCIMWTNRILLPKYTSSDGWPTTSTFLKFYDLEQDSVDVLFLGSSHMAAAVNPIQLGEEFGIRAYNLSSEQQNLFVSYYWLKEALRFQKPKKVVLDCYFLERISFQPLNSEESFIRKSMDYMKWSVVKREAVDELCSLDSGQSKVSYYLTNIRFHERWKNLTKSDFASYKEIADHDGLNGYKRLTQKYGEEDYMPIVDGADQTMRAFADPMGTYLDKIRTLCSENGIEMILIMTPYFYEDAGLHNTISAYARENQIAFYDFNEENLYCAIDYNFRDDNCEKSHVNENGASKITSYLGRILY